MDPVSASCYNLSQAVDDRPNSCLNLDQLEERSFRALLPQFKAALISTANHLSVGMALAFSAILIPQLQAPNSDIKVTNDQTSWIASVLALVSPIGALLSAYLMDKFGRVNTLKISFLPGLIGWLLMAIAPNIYVLIIGRIISGLASSLSTSPAVVYLTEVARKDLRGSFISLGPAYVSLGMVLMYLKGWLLPWRTICYLSSLYVIVPFVCLYFIPESPLWLVSKKRYVEAEKALEELHKNQPAIVNKRGTFAQLVLAQLVDEQRQKDDDAEKTTKSGIWREFIKPTGYKPLLILSFLFFFQQFAGIYIFLFYSISFFDEIGTEINPYIASILIGVIRLVMSMVNTYMLKTFSRRILVMTSATGMTICLTISSWATRQIQISGPGNYFQWLPIIFLLLYVVASMIGLLSIPWTMTAELFPLKIRGLAHSITTSVVNFLMFLAIQNYYGLLALFGGSSGLQLFFAFISFCTIFYTLLFLPETHGKTLDEIEEYFRSNTLYVKCGGWRKKEEEGMRVEREGVVLLGNFKSTE